MASFSTVNAAIQAPADVEAYNAAVLAFETTMSLLHPSRNSSPDAEDAMTLLYAMGYELHLR
eukprot:13802605-Alexandrium_andersonii.AAC.1